jgi:hypothetical protein
MGQTPEDWQRQFRDNEYAASLLNQAADIWRSDRKSYPEWLVCPSGRRQQLRMYTDIAPSRRDAVLKVFSPERRSEILYEIAWRHSVAHWPIESQLAAQLSEIADRAEPMGLQRQEQLDVAVTLLRTARRNQDKSSFSRWESVIENNAINGDHKAAIAYQRCLYALDALDYPTLSREQGKVAGADPIWRIRRASLLAELGRFSQAAGLVNEAVSELDVRQRQDRKSLWVRSRRAWAQWLSAAVQRDKLVVVSETKWPNEFRDARCDPWAEIEYIESEAQEELRQQREDAARVVPLFEPGHYREPSNTIRFGGAVVTSLDELDSLADGVGIPVRLQHYNLLGEAAKTALEAAFQPNFAWYARFLRYLHSSTDSSFARYFNRIVMARLAGGAASELSTAIMGAIAFWRNRISSAYNEDGSFDGHAMERLRVFIDALSRLTIHMTPEDARIAFDIGIEMASHRSSMHPLLSAPVEHLIKFSIQAVPPGFRSSLVLSALEFPLSSEIGRGGGPAWPNPIDSLFAYPPNRPDADPDWTRRIAELISAAAGQGTARVEAVLRLAYLAKHKALVPSEMKAFGQALWSITDKEPQPLPANTNLIPSLFAELPAPSSLDRDAIVASRVFGVDLSKALSPPSGVGPIQLDGQSESIALRAIASADQRLLQPTREQTVAIFNALTSWRPASVHDVSASSPFHVSFLSRFNKNSQRLIGQALAQTIIPALPPEERTEDRCRTVLKLIAEGQVSTAAAALPYFTGVCDKTGSQITQTIRQLIVGRTVEEVLSGSTAVQVWINLDLKSERATLPRELVDLIVSSVETRRIAGLSTALRSARMLIKAKRLESADLICLDRALGQLTADTAYERVDPESLEGVSTPFARAECVRVAHALQEASPGPHDANVWMDIAAQDALPEVRFALAEQSDLLAG